MTATWFVSSLWAEAAKRIVSSEIKLISSQKAAGKPKNGTRSLRLKIPSLWGARSCQITNEETLSPNQTGMAGVLPFSFQADDLCYKGQSCV